jgi:uncharacterized RDD family membrane protein YckC
MSDADEQPESKHGQHTPPVLKDTSLLDSVLHDDGPMPTARLRIRIFAALLDFTLLTALASIIIWKIAMPQAHPGAFAELNDWTQGLITWFSDSSSQPDSNPPALTPELAEALSYARDLQLIVFWLYFAIGEAFFAGSTLGKRACRLRTVSTVTLEQPQIMTGIIRGGLKTMALFFAFPLLLIATFVPLFFNTRRQMGHDLLSRTAVIDEKYVKTKPSS